MGPLWGHFLGALQTGPYHSARGIFYFIHHNRVQYLFAPTVAPYPYPYCVIAACWPWRRREQKRPKRRPRQKLPPPVEAKALSKLLVPHRPRRPTKFLCWVLAGGRRSPIRAQMARRNAAREKSEFRKVRIYFFSLCIVWDWGDFLAGVTCLYFQGGNVSHGSPALVENVADSIAFCGTGISAPKPPLS